MGERWREHTGNVMKRYNNKNGNKKWRKRKIAFEMTKLSRLTVKLMMTMMITVSIAEAIIELIERDRAIDLRKILVSLYAAMAVVVEIKKKKKKKPKKKKTMGKKKKKKKKKK